MQSAAHARNRLPEKPTFTSPQSSSSPANAKSASIALAKDAPSSSHLPPPLPIPTPLTLNSTTPLSLSKIEWPKDACVKWKVLELKEGLEMTAKEKEELMESARRKLVNEWREGLLDGLVGYMRRDGSGRGTEFWVFEGGDVREGGAITQFSLPGLSDKTDGHFHPTWLYACTDCVRQSRPCQKCNADPDVTPSPTMLAVREEFRRPLWLYLASLREKLLDRVAKLRDGCRFGDGVVYESTDRSPTVLDRGWSMDDCASHLVQVQIQLSLQARCLFIHPSLSSSSLVNLPIAKQSHPPPLTAVVLLPYGHPAYILNPFPTPIPPTTLDPYLQGLGTTSWRLQDRDAGWVECWVVTPPNVPNADSGFSVVWPSYLVAQDLSRQKLSQQLLPDSLRRTVPQPSITSHSWNFACDISARALRNTIDGPGYEFFVEVAAEQTIAADDAVTSKISSSKAHPEIQSVLADSVASYEFTRSAVAARDAARSGKVVAIQLEKEKGRESGDQEEQSSISFAQTLTVSRSRWVPVVEESKHADAAEQDDELDLDELDSEDLEPYLNDADMEEGDVTIRDIRADEAMTLVSERLSGAIDASNQRSPPDASMRSPSVQSVSSIASMTQRSSATRYKNKTKVHSMVEPLTPEGFDEDPINEDGKALRPAPPVVMPSSPLWETSPATGNDVPSLSMPALFGPTSSLIPPVTRIRPPAPRSDVSGDDGMEGLGLTEDDFAFYDAPSKEQDALVDIQSMEEDDITVMQVAEGLPSPPDEPIQIDIPEETEAMSEIVREEEIAEVTPHFPAHEDEEEGIETFPDVAPRTPSDGDRTPVGPLSPVSDEKSGFFDPFEPLANQTWKDSKYTVGKFAMEKTDFLGIVDDLCGESCFFTWNSVSKPLIEPFNNPQVGLIRRWQGTKRSRSAAFGEPQVSELPFKRMRCSWIDVEEVKRAAEQRRREDLELEAASDTTFDDETLVVLDEEEESRPVVEEVVPWPSQLFWAVTVVLGSFGIAGFTPNLPVPPASLGPPSPNPLAALTPVSPAAFIQMQDNLKKQEDAANIKCAQILDNPLVADWLHRTSIVLSSNIRWTSLFNLARLKKVIDGAIASPRLLTAGDLMDKTDYSSTDRSLVHKSNNDSALTTISRIFPIAIGLEGAVLNICWPAVRFWEKLAFSPLGGQKDVWAFAFHDRSIHSGRASGNIVKGWLKAVSQTYKRLGYGEHRLGEYDELQIKDGLLSGQLEELEPQLGILNAGLPMANVPHIVIYLFCSLQQLQSTGQALAWSLDTLPSYRMVIHLLPESVLFYGSHSPFLRPGPLDMTALSVYNRLLRAVKRTTLRNVYAAQPDEYRAIQYPAVTVAPRSSPTIDFKLEWPPQNADALSPVAYLHVAYTRTAEWVCAAAIDQLGEACGQRVWSTKQGEKNLTVEALVAKVWAFAWKFARRARKEWQIVIVRSGSCTVAEVEAWQSLLKLCTSLPLTVSFSLLSIETKPWQETLPNKDDWRKPPSPASSEGHGYIVDASGTTYGLCLSERFEIRPSAVGNSAYTSISPTLTCLEFSDYSEPPADWLRPLYTALLLQAPSDGSFTPILDLSQPETTMTTTRAHLLYYTSLDASRSFGPRSKFMLDLLRNYQELALLSREKWGRSVGSGILPWHIAAVVLMERILSAT